MGRVSRYKKLKKTDMGMNPSMEGHNLPPDVTRNKKKKRRPGKKSTLLPADLLDESLQDPIILAQVAGDTGMSIPSFLSGQPIERNNVKQGNKSSEHERLTRMEGEGKKSFHRRLKRHKTEIRMEEAKAARRTTEKRKRWLDEHKNKKRKKTARSHVDEAEAYSQENFAQPERVQFGDVAERPPRLNEGPRQSKKHKTQKKREHNHKKSDKGEMEAMRARVQEAYRSMKQKQRKEVAAQRNPALQRSKLALAGLDATGSYR